MRHDSALYSPCRSGSQQLSSFANSEARRSKLEADEMTLLRMCAIVVYEILTFWDCFIPRNQLIWRIMEYYIIKLSFSSRTV